MLSSASMPAIAAENEKESACRACEITLKIVVKVDIAKSGEPILNIAEINQSLYEWFSENFKFSCADGGCLTFDHQIEVYEVLKNLRKIRNSSSWRLGFSTILKATSSNCSAALLKLQPTISAL